MKLFGKKTLALALALTMVLALCPLTAMAADFAPSESGTTVAATKVTLNKASLMLEEGGSETLTATVEPEDATEKTVTWESSDQGVATVSSGKVTAVKAGTTIITATCGTATAQCTVNVTAKPVPVTSVTISGAKDKMVVGESVKLTATVQPENATDKAVTWKLTNGDAVSVAADGTVKAIKAGTATVMVEAGANTDLKTASQVITVVENQIVALGTNQAQTKSLPYGTTEAQVKAELAKIDWNVKYGNANTQVDGVSKLSASAWTCSNFAEKQTGSYTFTGSFGTNLNVTVTVTITKGQVQDNKVITYTTYKGVSKEAVINRLPSSVEVALNENGKYTFNIGSTGDFHWEAPSNYNSAVPATYTFTAVANSNTAANATFANIDMNGKTITAQVTVSSAYAMSTINETLYYSRGTTTSINLETVVKAAVNDAVKTRLGVTSTTVAYRQMQTMVCTNKTYGALGTGAQAYTYTADSSKFKNSGTMVENFTYSAVDTDGVTYSGSIALTIASSTFDISDKVTTSDPIVYFSGTSGIANKIAEAFKARYGSTPSYIDFGSIGRNDDELGTLYDGNGDSAEDGTYSFSSSDDDYDSVSNLYFVPTGVEGSFDIDYTAYTGSSKKMTGTITIDCAEMLVVWLNNLSAGETQSLSSSAIQEQVSEILDTTKLSYTLDTVTLRRPSTGTLYDGSSKKVTSSTKTLDAADVDDYTYEAPAKVSSNTLVTMTFTAKCKPDTGKSTKSADGVMLFNLTKKADITITAPANDAAVLGTDVFQTYFEKNASTTYRKNYEACYVVFSGAPNSSTAGYLYDGYKSGIINGSKIKSPNGKKFAMTDISAYDKNAYDLAETYYVPGTRGCTGGTFEIYGVKTGTTIKSSTRFTKLCEGTIDYVIGEAAAAITGTINASNYMQMTPSAFTKADKNASYVVFTAQPTGGKLVYNYNRTTPGVVTEISLNTPYYITYSAANANNYLGYVSFVPSYTSVKGVTNVIDIPCTVYNTSKKGTSCTVKISVVSATKSAKFTDVGVAYMASADSIDFLYNCGITTGTSSTGSLYNPTGTVTRGEWITMLYRAAGSPKMTNKVPFTDVTATNSYSWCYDAVRWAYQNGICQGTGATTFSPAMKLDRQQIVTFMYNYAVTYNRGNGAGSSISSYTDSGNVASWALVSMQWAVKNQYYTVSGNRLQPTDTATRADVAVYMHRLLTY